MKNTSLNLFSLIVFIMLFGNSFAQNHSPKNEELVKSFITARNNYNPEKIKTLVQESYNEIFADGTIEIENKAQLLDRILWGKEMSAKIELLDIKSDSNTVTTIEENTNYLDVALRRRSRKFRVVYTFNNNRIQHQKVDTLPGYHQLLKSNSEKYMKFVKYCRKHDFIYNHQSLNKESGIYLRAVLEKYSTDKK